MYKFKEGTVPLSDLKPCPHKVTLQTRGLLDEAAASARSDPGGMEPITVATVGDERYIVNGHLRAKALGMAGCSVARAHIVRVENLREAVWLHIVLNTHGSINPVAMMDAISYIRENGGSGTIPERHAALARGFLHEGPRRMYDEFLAEACKRYRTVDVPTDLVSWLASLDRDEQHRAARIIFQGLRKTRGPRLVFPSPADLIVMDRSLRPREGKEREVVIFESDEDNGKQVAPISQVEAERLVRGSSNDSTFHCSCGNRLLMNSRTRRVSSVRDYSKGKFIRLEGEEDARPLVAIPELALDFLDSEPEALRYVKIGSKEDLDKFTKSFKGMRGIRMVVILSR